MHYSVRYCRIISQKQAEELTRLDLMADDSAWEPTLAFLLLPARIWAEALPSSAPYLSTVRGLQSKEGFSLCKPALALGRQISSVFSRLGAEVTSRKSATDCETAGWEKKSTCVVISPDRVRVAPCVVG